MQIYAYLYCVGITPQLKSRGCIYISGWMVQHRRV